MEGNKINVYFYFYCGLFPICLYSSNGLYALFSFYFIRRFINMGVDYVWSGSSSYGRFLQEMGEIAKVFGAQVRKTAKGVQYYMYYEPIPEVVVGWLDCPYNYFPPQRTKKIWEAVRQHPEIEEISWQIWNELKTCVELKDGWYIY